MTCFHMRCSIVCVSIPYCIDINALLTQDDNGVSSINQELAKVFLGQLGVGSVLNVPTSPPSHPWNVTQWRTNIATLHKITKSYHEAEINQNGDVEVSSSKRRSQMFFEDYMVLF